MWRLGGLVGLALLLAALVTGLSTERFIHTASHADGAVVALSAGGSHPRVSFRTADGRAALFSGGGLISSAIASGSLRACFRASMRRPGPPPWLRGARSGSPRSCWA